MISVVVPLYNYAHYIEDNIQSILNQSINDWELIIVDDFSSDNPEKIIQKYLSDKIKLIRLTENCGYSVSKNIGIRASQGEYIVVLDADDILPTNSLGRRLKYLKQHQKVMWIHGRAKEFSGEKPYTFNNKQRRATRRLNRILQTKDYSELWTNIHAQTVMVRRQVYEKVGLYEPLLRSMGDKEMWARIINNIGIPAFLDSCVVYYRQHRDQMHRSKWKKKHLRRLTKTLHSLIERRKQGDLTGVERL